MDFSYPLEVHNKDIKLADSRNNAVSAVLSPLLTEPGERPMDPEYGSHYSLFQPSDDYIREIQVFYSDNTN